MKQSLRIRLRARLKIPATPSLIMKQSMVSRLIQRISEDLVQEEEDLESEDQDPESQEHGLETVTIDITERGI